jgi:[ribosomal protein S5]-alanine N-acetyltransferase
VIQHVTPRLSLRQLDADDAPFVLELLNDADFLRYIGDRKVRTLEQARAYIANGPVASYREFGFGLLHTSLKDGTPIGLCGLLQRDFLPDPDIGFALLPAYRARGYCAEAAGAVLGHADSTIRRIGAIVQPDNAASLALLAKLGFELDRPFKRSTEDREVLLLVRYT